MSEPSNGAWPFQEIPEEEGLDISAIFGDSSAAPQGDPFAPPAAAQSVPSSPTPVAQEITPAVAATSQPTTAPIAKAPVEAPAENPIAAAFEQKTAENTKKGLLEKPPVFYHKGVKEEIDDPSMTFEELRIRKSDDFTDLEEGKRVSWSVEYCGIRKEVKDPKGTTIISMKEMIERSREFLDALKKTKDKAPCCYIIIDCGLKHELLTINALAAADYCIIPVQAHFLASEGIPDVLEMVKNVQNRFNPDLKIAGILLTMYQSRPQLCQSVRNSVNDIYGESLHVFERPIEQTIKVAECPAAGVSILDYAPKNPAAESYRSLALEVLHLA